MQLTLLGSTGSIGTQTLEVAHSRGDTLRALAAGTNLDLLETQVRQFRPELISVAASSYTQAKRQLGHLTRVVADPSEVASLPADVCVNAMSGLMGLAPTRAALMAGRSVALATKEAMVTASQLMWDAARKGGGRLVPVDSEHTGIYQVLAGEHLSDVAELILTASGGPFRDGPADLSTVTPAQALKHPSWNMGRKISIDSATLFNKGLEVMECASLYGVTMAQVGVLVHPQSVVHAAVRFCDGNLKAQLGPTDMRLSIAYAIDAAPSAMCFAGDVRGAKRRGEIGNHLSYSLLGQLEFYAPDTQRFPCLALAYRAGELGGLRPTAINAADEVAVAAFLDGQLSFGALPRVLEQVLEEAPAGALTWESLEQTDTWARARTRELIAARRSQA